MGNYLLGLDIGTQGTKAALFDVNLNLIAAEFEPSNLISPSKGIVWQEADDLYASCISTIRNIVKKNDINPADILAIALDGQMSGIMGVDDRGEAVTYYDSWLDTRCEDYIDDMNAVAGERIIAVTGGPVSYNHGPKILWWKHRQPEAYKRIAKFLLPHAYVAGKMAGLSGDEAYFDYTNLHFSGFGDNLQKEWSKELLDIFEIDKSKMARIVAPFEIIGKVTKAAAAASGLIEGIPIAAGCGDTVASTFGSGMFESDRVMDCAGTATVLCCVVNTFVPDTENKTLTMMRSPIDGFWLPLAFSNGSGMCIRWFRDYLNGKQAAGYDELEAEALSVPIGCEGLMFVPHFSGRALPHNRFLKGSFTGLDFSHRRSHMYRAILESIAFEYAYYLSILRKNYPSDRFKKLITIGGGAKSGLLNQIKADVLGMEVNTFEMADTALLGIAAVAAMAAGVLKDYKTPIKKAIGKGRAYSADRQNHLAYQPFSKKYLRTIDVMTELYQSLS